MQAFTADACDWAGCSRAGLHPADEWTFCRDHLDEHHDVTRDDFRSRQLVQRRVRLEQGQLDAVVIAMFQQGCTDQQIADAIGYDWRGSVAKIRYRLGLERNAKAPAACGTRSGRQRHRDRGEPSCEPCAEAERRYQRDRHLRRRKAA